MIGLNQITGFQEIISRITNLDHVDTIIDSYIKDLHPNGIMDDVIANFSTVEDANLEADYARISHRLSSDPDKQNLGQKVKQAKIDRPISILNQSMTGYYHWLEKNGLNHAEYGVELDEDTYKLTKVQITRSIAMKILKKLGYLN